MSLIKQHLHQTMGLTCLPTCNLKKVKGLRITYQLEINSTKTERRCVEFINPLEACEWLNNHWPEISTRRNAWITNIESLVNLSHFEPDLKFIDTKTNDETNKEPTHQGADV